jgi:hypothetical protein
MNSSALQQRSLCQDKRSESLTQSQGSYSARTYTVVQERSNVVERKNNISDGKIYYLPYKLFDDIHEIEGSGSNPFSLITSPISTLEDCSKQIVKLCGKIKESVSSGRLRQPIFSDEDNELNLPLHNVVSCSTDTHIVLSEQIALDMEQLPSWKPHIVIDTSIFEDDE